MQDHSTLVNVLVCLFKTTIIPNISNKMRDAVEKGTKRK